jgi:hypothetical protein
MWGLRSFTAVGGFVALVVATAAGPSPAESGRNDSPESKLRAKIADLHAEVAILDVQCAAARSNLLEILKKVGRLELGDKQGLISGIKEEVRQKQVAVPSEPTFLLDTFRRNAEQGRLLDEYLKSGSSGDKPLERLAELELKARLEAAQAESERMKADFLKKCRLLHQKKLELADAEAEYKATK